MSAVAIGASAWLLLPTRTRRPSRRLVPTGLAVPLFDGRSLSGWNALAGAWTVRKNSEGGRVLSGTDGAIRHALFKQVGNKKIALERYRLTVVTQLHGATSAEVEFGGDNLGDGERYAARLAKDGTSIGRRAAYDGKYQGVSEVVPLSRAADASFDLAIERQENWWWFLIDETPIGSVPIAKQYEEPAFILRTDGGEALFSDITVQELASP